MLQATLAVSEIKYLSKTHMMYTIAERPSSTQKPLSIPRELPELPFWWAAVFSPHTRLSSLTYPLYCAVQTLCAIQHRPVVFNGYRLRSRRKLTLKTLPSRSYQQTTTDADDNRWCAISVRPHDTLTSRALCHTTIFLHSRSVSSNAGLR